MKANLPILAALLLAPLPGLRAADDTRILWDASAVVPRTADIPVLQGVRFSVIKPYEIRKDGYRFLHGVALAWHKGRLFASFAHNKGVENTDTEEARYCVSDDDGKTWSPVATIDKGSKPGESVSHGVFLSHHGQLRAFHGAFTGFLKKLHTLAYVFNETEGTWQPKGTVIEGDFWPCQEPVRMGDGNWIMSGFRVGVTGEENKVPSAVAVSHGDDFMKWDVVPIRAPASDDLWGESTVFVSGKHVVNIARYGAEAEALMAMSDDYGRTWSRSLPSNMPMTTSKPYAGTLSTGQRYLIGTTTADSGKRRSPLTIAVTRPGETVFSKVFVIRHAEFSHGPGESHRNAALSYPYAVEHDGHLYVGYSNNGGNVGRVGTGRELANNNSAELAVIPLQSLSKER
jgi:hypothetical protein